MVPSALSDLTYELPVESLKIVHEAELLLNNLGSLVSNGCVQLHVRELQVAIQRSKAKVSHRPADFIW